MKASWLFAVMLAVPAVGLAQDRPADNMAILREKLRADKKLVVAEALAMTEAEAKGFWPVYDAYQNEQSTLNDRITSLVKDYAASYQTMTDAKAKQLLDGMIAIERDRVALMQSYLPKVRAVLPELEAPATNRFEIELEERANQERFQAALTRLELQVPVREHLVSGAPSAVILEVVERTQADLLVMGSVSRSGIAGLLLGNTAERLLDRVACSLLTIKPHDFVSPV